MSNSQIPFLALSACRIRQLSNDSRHLGVFVEPVLERQPTSNCRSQWRTADTIIVIDP